MVSGVRQSTGLQPADIEFGHLIEVISAEESRLSPCPCLHLDRKPLKGGYQVASQRLEVELPFLTMDSLCDLLGICLLGRSFSLLQLTILFRTQPQPSMHRVCCTVIPPDFVL